MTDISPAPPFLAHYRFSRDDYLALVAAMKPKSYRLRIVLAVAWLSLFVLVIFLSSHDWEQFVGAMRDLATMNEVPTIFYLMIGLGLALIAFLPSLTMLRAMRLYSGYAIADRELDMELDEAGLRISGPGRETRLEWRLVQRAVTSKDYLFLAISRREALVLPARAFASPAAFAAATTYARARIAAG